MLDFNKACGRMWPKSGEPTLPSYCRENPMKMLEAAKDALHEWFHVANLSTSEGVQLRWCVQSSLEKYQLHQAEIESGTLSSRQQIKVTQESVLSWLQNLYAPWIYQSDIPEIFCHGSSRDDSGYQRLGTFRTWLAAERERGRYLS